MSHLNDSTMKRRILFSVMCAVITASVFAQGQGQGLAGIGKFSSGDPDTSKTAASWFFACIFLIVAATILRSFFL